MKYNIVGSTVPYVQINLENGKEVYTQSGGMCWRDENFEMITSTKGGLFKGLGRMLAGDSMFMNTYRATKDNAEIAFSTSLITSPRPFNISICSSKVLNSFIFT